MRKLLAGVGVLGVLLVVIMGKYIAPLVLGVALVILAWVSEESRAGFLVLLAILCLGIAGVSAISLFGRMRAGMRPIGRYQAAQAAVYGIIVTAFVLVGAGILGLVPGHPTLEIVLVLTFAGFVGVCALDESKPKTPQFPSDWKEPAE